MGKGLINSLLEKDYSTLQKTGKNHLLKSMTRPCCHSLQAEYDLTELTVNLL